MSLVLSNRSLAEVRFEQEEFGNPNFGCDLSPIDFASYAEACGAVGFHVSTTAPMKQLLVLRIKIESGV
jgi:thiamine pyrophosphate-dependent acetolactate synthase large subunit-like protein